LIPKAAYRVIGKHREQKLAPVLVDLVNTRAAATDRQFKKYLLCSDCELLFGLREDAVARSWCQRGIFLLRSELRQFLIYEANAGQRVFKYYPGVSLKQDELLYFALSIVWRASQSQWGSYSGLSLIPAATLEVIRRYLLGKGSKPVGTYLVVHVDWEGHVEKLITLPVESPQDGIVRVQFTILGIMFEFLFISDSIMSHDLLASSGIQVDVMLVLDKRRALDFKNNLSHFVRSSGFRPLSQR
jgi:hypothetical protein